MKRILQLLILIFCLFSLNSCEKFSRDYIAKKEQKNLLKMIKRMEKLKDQSEKKESESKTSSLSNNHYTAKNRAEEKIVSIIESVSHALFHGKYDTAIKYLHPDLSYKNQYYYEHFLMDVAGGNNQFYDNMKRNGYTVSSYVTSISNPIEWDGNLIYRVYEVYTAYDAGEPIFTYQPSYWVCGSYNNGENWWILPKTDYLEEKLKELFPQSIINQILNK